MLWVIRAFFVLVSSYYLSSILYKSQLKSFSEFLITFIYLLVLFSFVSYLHIKFVNNKQTHKKTTTFIYAVSALLVSVLLFAVFGSHFVYPYKQTTVTITATTEKNAMSKTSEVWIASVNIDGQALDLTTLTLPDNWVLTNGSVMYSANRSSSMTLNFKAAKHIEITFLKHPWSGIAELKDGSATTMIDLYAPNGDKYVYTVKSNLSNQITSSMLVDYSMAVAFLFSTKYLLICTAVLYIAKKRN